jgi:hypothetical protein
LERAASRCPSPRCPHRNARKDTHPASRDKLSPLSPTFGPRKGLVPSGTVARKRHGPRYVAVPFVEQRLLTVPGVRDIEPHPARAGKAGVGMPAMIVVYGDEERRVLWGIGRGFLEKDVKITAENLEEAVEEEGG